MCESRGCGGDVDAVQAERWDLRGEEGVEEERYAACARAEVERAERFRWPRGGREDEGGEVGGYVFCFGPVDVRQSLGFTRTR